MSAKLTTEAQKTVKAIAKTYKILLRKGYNDQTAFDSSVSYHADVSYDLVCLGCGRANVSWSTLGVQGYLADSAD